jgi:hypothetical protein
VQIKTIFERLGVFFKNLIWIISTATDEQLPWGLSDCAAFASKASAAVFFVRIQQRRTGRKSLNKVNFKDRFVLRLTKHAYKMHLSVTGLTNITPIRKLSCTPRANYGHG